MASQGQLRQEEMVQPPQQDVIDAALRNATHLELKKAGGVDQVMDEVCRHIGTVCRHRQTPQLPRLIGAAALLV